MMYVLYGRIKGEAYCEVLGIFDSMGEGLKHSDEIAIIRSEIETWVMPCEVGVLYSERIYKY